MIAETPKSQQAPSGSRIGKALAWRNSSGTSESEGCLSRENEDLRAELKRVKSILTGEILRRRQLMEWVFEAQEQYRRAFDNAVEGMFLCTVDGAFFSVNRVLASIHGFDSPEDLMAEMPEISSYFVHPGRHVGLKGIMQGGGAVIGFGCQARRRDGTMSRLLIDIRPIRDAEGSVLHYEGRVEDVTERQRLWRQIGLAHGVQSWERVCLTVASGVGFGNQ